MLAFYRRAERPAPVSMLLPVFSIMSGVYLCVIAEVWQPEWLRSLCADPTYFLFPGQYAAMQQKTFGAILVLVGIIDLEVARRMLSRPWLVAKSQLSFPLYLIHWPILFGPAAALFLLLNGMVGIELAGVGAIVAGIGLSFVGSIFFLTVDRRALELSRALRKRMSAEPRQVPRPIAIGATRIVPAE
jgi:peptidoglycan/LPS O-acetylase OafA/YrhL